MANLLYLKKIVSLLIPVLSIHISQARDFSAYKKELFIRGGGTLRYRMLYPESYEPGKSYPLVIFLHGAGWRGNDNERQPNEGGRFFLNDSVRKKFPAMVVLRQCLGDSMWFNLPPGTKQFAFYGKEIITRLSSSLLRALVTKGTIKDIARSDDNPFGAFITNWQTISNKDISNSKKGL